MSHCAWTPMDRLPMLVHNMKSQHVLPRAILSPDCYLCHLERPSLWVGSTLRRHSRAVWRPSRLARVHPASHPTGLTTITKRSSFTSSGPRLYIALIDYFMQLSGWKRFWLEKVYEKKNIRETLVWFTFSLALISFRLFWFWFSSLTAKIATEKFITDRTIFHTSKVKATFQAPIV